MRFFFLSIFYRFSGGPKCLSLVDEWTEQECQFCVYNRTSDQSWPTDISLKVPAPSHPLTHWQGPWWQKLSLQSHHCSPPQETGKMAKLRKAVYNILVLFLLTKTASVINVCFCHGYENVQQGGSKSRSEHLWHRFFPKNIIICK